MRCEDCIHYNVEEKKCSKILDPNNCTEFKDWNEYWSEAREELCEWACENNVYDDVVAPLECECWDEYPELVDDEFYKDYEEEDDWGYYDEWE